MIIYQEVKKNFLADIEAREIEEKISNFYFQKFSRRPHPSEKRAWKHSLDEMYFILNNHKIPDEAKVTIEYNLPTTNRRVDFIISGKNNEKKSNAVLVELKQWEIAKKVTDGREDMVVTALGGNPQVTTPHPSYQIWSYLQFIKDYSRIYWKNNYNFKTCAYLHNYQVKDNEPLLDNIYSRWLNEAPIFFKKDKNRLVDFISNEINGTDDFNVIKLLDEETKIPSLTLQKDVAKIILNNKEFTLLDSQKVIFEEIKNFYLLSKKDKQKRVVIVDGEPGSGKSVLAFQLLAKLLKKSGNVAYVTKNEAVRKVFKEKLCHDYSDPISKMRLDSLILGSGQFMESDNNIFDCLIVDEAHRLNLKSGFLKNKGKNQIQEIINASRLSVFFVDDNQIVTTQDIGWHSNIYKEASKVIKSAENILELKLDSQFRLNGSNNFLDWLDNILDINDKNESLVLSGYDFQIIDSIDVFYEKIKNLNVKNNARMLAGYCWEWNSKKNNLATDINLSDNFKKKWNLNNDNIWAINKESFEQIGCIHTAQGLEFEYVGVIIGDDLDVEGTKLITKPSKRAKSDKKKTLAGLVGKIKQNDPDARKLADKIIKNTYRVLLTRATKGCYVYFTNPKVKKYFQEKLNKRD